MDRDLFTDTNFSCSFTKLWGIWLPRYSKSKSKQARRVWCTSKRYIQRERTL